MLCVMHVGDDPVSLAIRHELRLIGPFWAAVGLTIVAIAASMAVTAGVLLYLRSGVDRDFMIIAVGVPAVLTPSLTYFVFKLLLRLEVAEERLHSLATVDDLTQVFNRKHLISMTESELQRAKRYGNPFSLMLVAVDDFRKVNESQGRLAGDKLLQTLTGTVRRQIRPVDLFARFGGAEFVILQPQTTADEALVFANRIRESLARTPVLAGSDVLDFTVAIGLTTCTEPKAGLEPLFHRLEEALLDGQDIGPDRVAVR